MSQSTDPSSLVTRPTLLFRLRDWADDVSWEEFYRLYFKLVYGVARRAGLPHHEAEEVANDVFKRVSETIETFESNPQRGSFRGWLMNLTRWKVVDRFRARKRTPMPSAGEHVDREETPAAFPDPVSLSEAAVDSEWREHLFTTALARVARRVPAKQLQAFNLYKQQSWPVLEVARELGMNPASVYVISHRMTKELRLEVERLMKQLG